ncbi:hypothetical protein Tsac_2848 [Thermoanaerobacterium phage THSA-485A]|uniref:hypothetical protein n=1 Tax=Thermoanaerobacterium phage THSA-485A TaxID=1126885 RepID=UPI000263F839|nr:hypothetical protein Tsac_2848 [Thermoanaerobacterium phage THSA-485A]AFK87701.1 hypothetical protein Tsac_2848 [Thermoanaerobacterium phage THSA-485A]
MSIQILIGGQDYTQYVDFTSIDIQSNIAVQNDTASCDVVIPQQCVPRPKAGQEIKFINNGVIEFGGVIVNPKETALATDVMMYQLDCRDYTFLFNKKLVTNTYNGYTIGNIVKDIVNNFTTGFTTNHVYGTSQAFYLSQVKFDHVAPSDAIKKLADDINFQFWIDYNRDVHFSEIATIQSPLPNNSLNLDTDTQNYSDLEFDEDISQVRNQIYLLGYKLPANYSVTQNFVCDGQNNTFTVTYEPKHSLSSITVTLNGTAQQVKLDLVNGTPASTTQDNTCYVNYSNKTFRFNVAPASGQILSITYVPMFDMISMYNDPNAIATMAQRDGTDGVYEYAIHDSQLTSTDSSLANIRGQLELYKYAYPHYTGQFNSFLQGWETGQYFFVTSNRRMDGQFQNQVFYVVKVEKKVAAFQNSNPVFRYTVYFSDTPYVF